MYYGVHAGAARKAVKFFFLAVATAAEQKRLETSQWRQLSPSLRPITGFQSTRTMASIDESQGYRATVTRAKRGGGGDVPAPKRSVPTTRPPTVAKKKKDVVLELGLAAQKPETAIIRGPMPAHLLCPTNAKHPGAKMMRKTMSKLPKRPTSRDGDATAAVADKVNGGPLSLPGPEFDTSRDASKFEKILNETSNDWSQLSRMKKMMENDTESMVADAIVTQLANGATKDLPQSQKEAGKEIARLPNMEIDSKSSSGLRKRPSSTMGGLASEGADNQSSSGSKSLFAAVVGGVEKKESRKKRRK